MTLTPKSFDLSIEHGIAAITLARPERLNSLTFEVYRELADTFDSLSSAHEARVITITGRGRGFCSGGDQDDIIAELFSRDMRGLLEFTRMTGRLIASIRTVRRPVIAAIHGACVGAGAVIAAACDLRICDRSSKFGFIFPKVGLSGADMGASYLLPRIVGLGRASEILYFGEIFDADEAMRLGFVNRVVDAGKDEELAKEWAWKLAKGPAFAHSMTKEMLEKEHAMTLAQAIEAEAQAQAICMEHPDFEEAHHAWKEKRAPRFAGSEQLGTGGKDMKLSTDSLGLFFDSHHHALAEGLVRMAHDLADVPHGIEGARIVARAMGDKHGLYGFLVPEALGGFPVGKNQDPSHIAVRSLCLIREMLGWVSPMADSIFAVQGLGSFPIVLAGTKSQRDRFLPGVLTGARIGAFALTEPEAGSDVASMRCVARKERDEGFVLDGEKVFISNVGVASHYIVFANANPSEGRRGITAFLVEEGTPGLTSAPMDLSIDHPIGRLTFESCRVGKDALLGEIGEGFKLAMTTLDTFRVSVGAAAVGMASRALDETVKRVKTRTQFGKPLAEQSVVQSMLADMATELDAARLLVLRAAHAKDTGRGRTTTEVSMAKLYATEAAQRIIDHAVQLHGGMGVVQGSVVERLYREIRPLRIYEGTSEIQRLIIGSALVKEAK